MTIIPAARITGEVVVRPRGVEEMDEKKLAAIRERLEKATPGPWHAWERAAAGWAIGTAKRHRIKGNDDIACISFYQCRFGHDGGPFYTNEDRERDRADAEFIARAREDIPVLLAEVDRLRTIEWACRRALIRCQVVLDSLDCECDSYNGFTCTLHADREMVKQALAAGEGGAK